MTKEVLKQALECAERCESIDGIDWSDTIDAIKEALAQSELMTEAERELDFLVADLRQENAALREQLCSIGAKEQNK